MQQIDVNKAFLNGDLQETMFMHQPPGFTDQSKLTHMCRLIKALYGLKQALCAGYDKLHDELIKWGVQNSQNDTSLFHYKFGSVCLFSPIYMDDILITDSDNSKFSMSFMILNSSSLCSR